MIDLQNKIKKLIINISSVIKTRIIHGKLKSVLFS